MYVSPNVYIQFLYAVDCERVIYIRLKINLGYMLIIVQCKVEVRVMEVHGASLDNDYFTQVNPLAFPHAL